MSPEQPNIINMILPAAVVWGIFYFLVFQPQQKKQKELKKQLEGIKKNDDVVTSGGIHGTVVIVKEKTIVIRVDEHARLEIDREHIATVQARDAGTLVAA